METMELLCARKSVRSYTGEKVSRETLDAILKAGWASPAGAARFNTMHFTVIEDPQLLAEIDSTAAGYRNGKYVHPLYGAPTLILISISEEGNSVFSNAAIAAHNMSLAAVDAGEGQCLIWGCIRMLNKHPEVVEKLHLPKGYTPSCGVIVGKTTETYEIREIPKEKIATDYIL